MIIIDRNFNKDEKIEKLVKNSQIYIIRSKNRYKSY